MNFKIKKVTLLLDKRGPDRISIKLDCPTAHPNLGYPVICSIDAQAGYGLEWCEKVLKITPEVIHFQ